MIASPFANGTMSALTGNLLWSNRNTTIPELRTSNHTLEKTETTSEIVFIPIH